MAKLTLCLCVLLSASAFAQGPGGRPPGGNPGGGRPPAPPPSQGAPPANGGPNGSGANGASTGTAANAKNATVTSSGGVRIGPPGRWWDDKAVVQAVGLSHDQQKRMDAIFNANKTAIVQAYENFEKQQAALNALSKNPQVDKAQMFAAIDSVNQARAALAKANTEMKLEILKQLQPSQATKLDSLP